MNKYLRGLFLVAMLTMGLPAQADIVYNWEGTCTVGCTGQATGILTLSDSYDGSPGVHTSEFVSWTFSSDTVNYSIPADFSLDYFEFRTGTDLIDIFLRSSPGVGAAFFFVWATDGVWISDYESQGGSIVEGINGLSLTRVNVPVPASLALIGAGLLALNIGRKRMAR